MKVKICSFFIGISILLAISQGLSLSRHARVAEKIPFFLTLNETAVDENSTIRERESSRLSKPNFHENLNTFPRLVEEFIIPLDNEDDDAVKTINAGEKPKNVILLFIQESGTRGQDIWRDLEKSHIFPIHGHLQGCQNEGNFNKFPLERSMNSDYLSECDCRGFLQRNVGNLLEWADRMKMSRSSVVTRQKLKRTLKINGIFPSTKLNRPIYSLLAKEAPILHMELFGELSELKNHWHLLDLNNENLSFDKLSGEEELNGFFGQFSMIRIAIFEKWLISLLNSNERVEDLEGNLVELVKDTIAKTKFLPDDKNFVFIAFTPGNELSAAVDFIKQKVSSEETLLLVTGTCSEEGKGIPFFARGPGSTNFYEANSIFDLPLLIKRTASNCEGLWCKIESFNRKFDHRKRFSKRTVKNQVPEQVVETSTLTQNVTNGMNNTIADSTTIVPDKKEMINSTFANVTITTILPLEVKVDSLKNLQLTNSSLENNTLDVGNSTNSNVTNIGESMRNSTLDGVPAVTKLEKVVAGNNSKGTNETINETKITTIDDIIRNTIEEKSTTTKASEEEIIINWNFQNKTNGGNETENNNATSEASDYSKQTSTVVISVATSFAALLLFQF